MHKVLVTGGAGYIGSHAVRGLLEADYQVTVIDNLSKGHREAVDAGATLVKLDLADSAALEKVFQTGNFDAVMHFAGSIEVGLSMTDPALFFDNNVGAGMRLLEAMRKNGVKKLIFSSTAAVYGNPIKIPIKENASLYPANFYGQSKLMFEQLLQKYDEFYGLKSISLRYFNASGAHPSAKIGQDYEPATHLIERVLKAALGQIPDFKIFGTDYPTKDGTCIRDYVHVCDLVDAHLLALNYLFRKNKSDVFNLANGRGFSVREVIDAAQKIIGSKIHFNIGPRRKGDPAVLIADSRKAQKILGWKPRFEKLEDIIASAWEWHLAYPDGYASRTFRSIRKQKSKQSATPQFERGELRMSH